MSEYHERILLESGTNELEIILFELGQGCYAINVLKVREIVNQMPVTTIPNAPQHVEGIISLRGEIIPVVDLSSIVNAGESNEQKEDKFIVAELNQIKVAFRVHSVSRISRISWEQIEKPNELTAGKQPYATGIIKLKHDTLSIFLDIEKIIVEINPDLGGNSEIIKTLGPRERSMKSIIVAEDSGVLRALLRDTLSDAGYDNVTFYQNGKEAWNYLDSIAEDETINPLEKVQLILSDIEMPQMDGHHLTYRIKHHARLKDIPVIIFSSLITEDLYHKGERVGADSQISKPKLIELVKEIDRIIL
jgi:two-component system, chemotaxis family, chemotaxis protein CheV